LTFLDWFFLLQKYYLGKLYDNQIKNIIVKLNEVKEPNKIPLPIFWIFEFLKKILNINPINKKVKSNQRIEYVLSNNFMFKSNKN
jgi:hypothetical protein